MKATITSLSGKQITAEIMDFRTVPLSKIKREDMKKLLREKGYSRAYLVIIELDSKKTSVLVSKDEWKELKSAYDAYVKQFIRKAFAKKSFLMNTKDERFFRGGRWS